MTAPTKCRELIESLTDNDWSFVLKHGVDTGESPFISIEALRGDDRIWVTWHTRATGTYRLFSCLLNKRVVTLTKAMQAVAA